MLSASQTTTNVVLRLVETLRQRYDGETTESAIGGLFDLCHNSNKLFQEYQNAAYNLGVVDLLLHYGQSSQVEECRKLAFRALGQMCFNNVDVSRFIGQNRELASIVSSILSDPISSADLKEEALYSVKNAAANSWQSHANLIGLVPIVVALLKLSDPLNSTLRSQCVFFLGVLAYNKDSRAYLIEAGAVPPLVEVMNSHDTRLFPTSAAIAVACLVGEDAARSRMCGAGSQLIRQLVDAFEATLLGKAYPAGSELYYTDWKLMMGIVRLAQNVENKQVLIEAGMIKLLHAAVGSARSTPQLVQYCLEALWLLTFDFSTNPPSTSTSANTPCHNE